LQDSTEYPTPGENLARKRIWGNFLTFGSRSIRESQEYVRQGGAAARDMLIRAAAAGWGVSPAQCSAANSVITHKPSTRTTTYGKVAEASTLPFADNPPDCPMYDVIRRDRQSPSAKLADADTSSARDQNGPGR